MRIVCMKQASSATPAMSNIKKEELINSNQGGNNGKLRIRIITTKLPYL